MSRKVAPPVPRTEPKAKDSPELKYDNRGFDPREGGELEGRWRPKSAQVRRALRGKLGKRT